MHKWRAIILSFFLGCGVSVSQTATNTQPLRPGTDRAPEVPVSQTTTNNPEAAGIIIEAAEEFEVNLTNGVTVATNGITIRYQDAVLTAQRATINQYTGDVTAQGNVRLQHGPQLLVAESLQYNFLTKKIIAQDFRSGQSPYYAQSDVMVGNQAANVYAGADGFITTDDYANPDYTVNSKTLILVPGEYIIAKNATLRLKGVPVFYYPYYRRSLKHRSNHLVTLPGYRNKFGPFLLNTYYWYWHEQLDGAIHADERAKRGLGYGGDLNLHLSPWSEGQVKYYRIDDQEPGSDFNNKPIHHERERLWLAEEATLRTNLTAKVVVRYQSDPLMIHDFFESEYRKNVQPSSFAEVNQLWSNFSLDALAQPRVNEFFDTVERLPDIRLTGFRQQIGATPLFYESESSYGYFRHKFGAGETNLAFAAQRADTFHQVVLPLTFFNWLNVSPRAGGRFTYYEEAEGPGATTSEHNRTIFNTGAEVTTKASRLWPAVSSRFWEVDGLRHIIQPLVNYVYVPNPSVPPSRLPQFDTVIPSTRLLPIEFPDFNAIDAIDSQNVLRLSLRNKLQTKRKDGVENLINWAVYTDWRLKPRAGQSTFSDWFSDADLKPFHWLTLNSEVRYDVGHGLLNEANHTAVFSPTDVWSLALGHRYLRAAADFGTNSGNNLFFSSVYYRFNENWATRMSHHFEGRDGTLEEQFYTLYRDLRSWTASLTFRIRDNRSAGKDYTVAFVISLKAFPRFGVGGDSNDPSLLIGR